VFVEKYLLIKYFKPTKRRRKKMEKIIHKSENEIREFIYRSNKEYLVSVHQEYRIDTKVLYVSWKRVIRGLKSRCKKCGEKEMYFFWRDNIGDETWPNWKSAYRCPNCGSIEVGGVVQRPW
jgi:hypothetical protein